MELNETTVDNILAEMIAATNTVYESDNRNTENAAPSEEPTQAETVIEDVPFEDTETLTQQNIQPEQENTTYTVENIIPEIYTEENTTRFNGAPWKDLVKNNLVTIIGAGGIGSYVAFMFCRMNASITVCDDDVVEPANLGGQLMKCEDVGIPKVHALFNIVYDLTAKYFTYYQRRYGSDNYVELRPVVISCVDNMSTRKVLFENWKRRYGNDPNALFLDGRLAAECFQVFCIRGGDTYSIDKYEKNYLFSSEEADETVCSYKQTTFAAAMIGSVITNLYINSRMNMESEVDVRPAPFKTEYDATTMLFKTED